MHTDLEALHVWQSRLRFDHIFLCSVDLKALHHIDLDLGGLRADLIGGAPRLLCPKLVARHLACSRHMGNVKMSNGQ